MMRRALAIIATMALSGCQHSGQQAVDPFWGRTTVPPPPLAPWASIRAIRSRRRSRRAPATPCKQHRHLICCQPRHRQRQPRRQRSRPLPRCRRPRQLGRLTCLLRRPYPRRLIIAHPLRDTPVWVQLHPALARHLRQPLIRERRPRPHLRQRAGRPVHRRRPIQQRRHRRLVRRLQHRLAIPRPAVTAMTARSPRAQVPAALGQRPQAAPPAR